MAGTSTRAETRARAAAKATPSTTEAIDEEPTTPVVPPPAADQLDEDIVLQRLALLEEVTASLSEKLSQMRDQADERAADEAEAAEKTAAKLDEISGTFERITGEVFNTNKAVETLADVLAEVQNRKVPAAEVERELGLTGAHIHAGVIKVMRDVRSVGKAGKAPEKVGGYAFRKVDDIMDAVGASMRDHGLYLRPEVIKNERREWTANGRLVTEVVLTMRYTWVSGVDGTSFSVEVVGEGRDSGDKATSKAQAMCLKTMLLQTLCIPLEEITGHDVESEAPESSAPERRQQATAYGHGHQPANSPGGRAHAQAQQQAPPAPDRQAPQETPEQQAARGLAAARRANNLDELEKVRAYAEQIGLLHAMVEGSQLQVHLLALRGVLGGAPASPEEMPPPPEEQLPWGDHQ